MITLKLFVRFLSDHENSRFGILIYDCFNAQNTATMSLNLVLINKLSTRYVFLKCMH